MMNAMRFMVVTDLDGTLIDHDTYSWAAAKPALAALADIEAAVILASSKTAPEISQLRTALNLDHWPAIVENGAGVLPPHVTEIDEGNAYAALRIAIDACPAAQRTLFRGFGDMTAHQVADATGLTLPDAEMAKQRAFSEPGQWLGNEAEKATLVADLRTKGIIAQQGGRFLTLSFGGNKADKMRHLIATYKPEHTVALGDAPNDIQMLTLADFGIVVTNPHRPPLPPLDGEADGRIIRTTSAGPKGWNTAILDLLDRLKLQEDDPHG